MKKYKINDKEYELIENYKEGFDLEIVTEKITEYFDDFDYIVGDWSYGKMRLKGFCDKGSPNYKKINDIKVKESYINDSCSYECKYFVLKKISQ